MTTPSLSSDGYMRWPPRAWAESLCTPLPDGTWLVQAPIAWIHEPQLYLLPDTETKERYLTWATASIWRSVLLRSLSPLVSVLPVCLGLVNVFASHEVSATVSLISLLPFLLWGLAYAVTYDRLLGLLPARASQPLEAWQRQGILARSAAEWEALYLSNGLRVARIAWLISIGSVATWAVLRTVAQLDLCNAAGILDGTVLELEPLRQPDKVYPCGWLWSWSLGLGPAGFAFVVFAYLHTQRRQRAGRASPLAQVG